MIPGFCYISYISLENFLIGWHIKYACLITRLEKKLYKFFPFKHFSKLWPVGKKGKLFSIFKIMVLKQCFRKGSVFCDFCLCIFWELLQKKIIKRDRVYFGTNFFSSKLHIYKLTKWNFYCINYMLKQCTHLDFIRSTAKFLYQQKIY